MDFRILEKNKKIGFLFYIRYNGTKFFSFDEMKDKKTVKGTFRQIMERIGFSWAKGIQQAGRTDSKVSANENILYVSSLYQGDTKELQDRFNEISDDELKITMIKRTFPNLELPDLIEKREYIYNYPKKKIKNSEEDINRLCQELTGRYDVSEFTDKKGLELKEHIREVEISYDNGKLKFVGNSFMPKQVRIMSGYILIGKKEAIEGKYLTLEKIYLSQKLKDSIFIQENELKIENVEKIEKTKDGNITIFHVKKGKKSEFIGKNGKNIKKYNKDFGKIVVRECDFK